MIMINAHPLALSHQFNCQSAIVISVFFQDLDLDLALASQLRLKHYKKVDWPALQTLNSTRFARVTAVNAKNQLTHLNLTLLKTEHSLYQDLSLFLNHLAQVKMEELMRNQQVNLKKILFAKEPITMEVLELAQNVSKSECAQH